MTDQTEQEQKAPCAHCGRTNWRWTGEYWFDDPAAGPPSYRRSEIRCDWCAPLRMNAYYYGFSSTGVELVDRVLSAVAMAGKDYHYTGSWSDEGREDWGPFRGGDYVSWIQNAASDVAALLRERDAQIASLSAERDAAIDENIRLTNAEIETLRARLDGWRDLVINITAALNRPGGAFYEDVPRHVKELRAERDAAQRKIATITEALDKLAREEAARAYGYAQAKEEAAAENGRLNTLRCQAEAERDTLRSAIQRFAARQANAAGEARRQRDPGAPERARTHNYCSAILELLLEGD